MYSSLSSKLKVVFAASINAVIMSVMLFLFILFRSIEGSNLSFSNFSLVYNFMFYLIPEFGWESSFWQILGFLHTMDVVQLSSISLVIPSVVLGLSVGIIIGIYLTFKYQNKKDSSISSKLRILTGTISGLAFTSVLLFLHDFLALNNAYNLLITNGLFFHLTKNWVFGVWFLIYTNIPQISSIFLSFISVVLGLSVGLIIGIYLTLKYQDKKDDQKSN